MVLVYVLQRVREVSFTTMKTLWRGFLIGTDLLSSTASLVIEKDAFVLKATGKSRKAERSNRTEILLDFIPVVAFPHHDLFARFAHRYAGAAVVASVL
jgi:hypothetical protein